MYAWAHHIINIMIFIVVTKIKLHRMFKKKKKWFRSHDKDVCYAHIWYKLKKNLMMMNRWTDFIETWYVAVGTLSNYSSPWVDLDLFYSEVKFGHISFLVKKCENQIDKNVL